MSANLQNLIDVLKKIEQDDNIVKTVPDNIKDKYGAYCEDDLHPLIQEATGLACENLINNDGSCNWRNINDLSKAGYNVTCGEKDSFGWLTGVIHTKKGLIIYG
jgi:hypothetical protein